MFTIKVTYRGQTRKLVFSDISTFPPYDEICSQLLRVFPNVSQPYYLSKLLFSPDASRSGRILVGKEVRSAHDYSRVIRTFRNRTWTNGLLRFEVHDSSENTPRPDAEASSTRYARPAVSHRSESMRSRSSMSCASLHSTTQPSGYSTVSETQMVVDESIPTFSARREDKAPAQHQRPLPQRRVFTRSCCDVSQGTGELREILGQFQSIINRTMVELSPASSTSGGQTRGAEFMRAMGDAPPPSLCSVCTRNIGASHEKQSDWYSCANCHVVICGNCHNNDHPGFCLSTMGPHNMQLAVMSSGRATTLPIPHLPSPWASRPSLSPLDIPSNNQASTEAAPAPPAASRSPSEVVHRGVICDVCNDTIKGIRHKCLDCPDFDLCTSCIGNGGAESHNPFHEFFEIAEPGRVVVHTVFSGDGERETPRVPTRNIAQEVPLPSEPVVHPATCNLCESRIIGSRYKCAVCPDFDTCSGCFSIIDEQHPGHAFLRVQKPEDFIRVRAEPRPMHYATCNACHRTIYGTRFKCMHPECPDYDLCENCEAHPIPIHPSNHPLLKMKSSDTVIPTVYRVGQKLLIPQVNEGVQQSVQTAAEPELERPSPSRRATTSGPPVPPKPFMPEVPPMPSVTLPTVSTRPPLPPKPEMISHPSWATIPGFFNSSADWQNHRVGNSSSVSFNDDVNAARASLINPFADIPMVESPVTSAIHLPPSPQEPIAENSRDMAQVSQDPVISLPSVPSHLVNPWPTTNWEERAELLRKLAAISSTSCGRDSSIVGEVKNIPIRPPSIRPIGCQLPVNPYYAIPPQQVAANPVPAEVSEEPKVSEQPQEDHSTNSFADFTMSHLLQGLEERIASLKQGVTTEKSPVSVSDASISGEPLVNRRPSMETITADLRDLVQKLPTLVPKKETVKESIQSDLRSLSELVNELPTLSSVKLPSAEPQSLSAAFLEDVTVPDGQVFPPGAEFMKCWRLRNDSGHDWPASTELVFVAGDTLAASSPVEIGPVAAGAEIHVWTGELKAPDAPGRYVGYWRLRADGTLFGNSLWIEINVAESDIHHSSDESMAASSIIMPNLSSPQDDQRVPSATIDTESTRMSLTSTDDNISDAGSDISLISLPSSPSDDEDEMLWHDSRSQTTAERAAAAARSVQSRNSTSAMDYVLLYDDNSSSEE